MQFRLENPQALWAIVPLMLLALRMLWKRHRQPMLFSWRRTAIAFSAFVLCIVALARPQGGRQVTGQKGNQSNLFIAVDISRSMLAEDVLPSRLGFTVRYIEKLLKEIGTARVALYSFAQEGYLYLPLTSDLYAVADSLQSLHPSNSTAQGTNLSDALRGLLEQIKQAEERVRSRGGEWAPAQVVLFSDGESHDSLDSQVTKSFQAAKIPIFTVQVGTPVGGTIPLEGRFPSSNEILRDESGRAVISKANPVLLSEIARGSGGATFDGNLTSMPSLVGRLRQAMQMGKLTTTFRLEREFFPFLLIGSLVLYLLQFFMFRWEFAVRAAIACFLFSGLTAYAEPEKKAAEAYNQALQLVQEGSYEKAAELFQEAAIASREKKVQKQALFNMANSFLRMGDPTQALMGYQSAHDINTGDDKFDQEANQKISDNILLAAKLEEQQQKQKKKSGSSGEGNDPKDQAEDPGGAKKFESEPMTEGAKQRIYDQMAAEERQAFERLRDRKRKGNPNQGKTW